MRNRTRSKIDERLRELSWLYGPTPPAGLPQGRESASERRMTWLGSDLVFDPRTGRIQAL